MSGALISQEQLRQIAERTRAREVTILRRLVGLPVRGAAAYAVDIELARLGLTAGGGGEAGRAGKT